MTDKQKLDAIKAEIHRLVDVRGYDREMANDLLAFMNSLPNEPVSEDLDFIATRNALAYVNNINRGESPWLDSDIELAYEDGMKAGANWQKEQMMAKAVDAIVQPYDAEIWLNSQNDLKEFAEGEEVKVTVIKKDEL